MPAAVILTGGGGIGRSYADGRYVKRSRNITEGETVTVIPSLSVNAKSGVKKQLPLSIFREIVRSRERPRPLITSGRGTETAAPSP